MNDTAKKLRDITQNAGVTPGSDKPYGVIAAIKSAFGFDSILAAGVLLQFMAAIADELDELQAKANDANNLRQKLDSAEKKAERRKKQVEHTEDAIRERNARLKMRAELLEQAVNENRELRKQVPTERERAILDMWPRFEDGECVLLGDKYEDNEGNECFASGVHLDIDGPSLVDSEGFHDLYRKGKCVKRPAPKVLDADGVEIHVGDTVWHCNGIASGVVTSIDAGSLMNTTRYVDESGNEFRDAARSLTHTRPDSWDLLEMEAESIRKSIALHLGDYSPSCFKRSGDSVQDRVLALVCRAKALAGAEVSE